MANSERLIDAFRLTIHLSKRNAKRPLQYDDVLAIIADEETVDAVEVVHGRWEWLGPNNLIPECMCGTCSACKVRSKYIVNTDLCPNCGAKMDGDGNA